MLANGYDRLLNGGMKNILTPITEIDSLEASRSLLVSLNLEGNQRLLRSRNLNGVLHRYGSSVDEGQEYFERAQEQHDNHRLGAFIVRSAENQIVGMATIYPSLQLKKIHLPMPPMLARGPLATSYDYEANVSAWAIGPDGREMLRAAYREVTDIALNGLFRYARVEKEDRKPFVWTIEPTGSPHFHFVDKVLKESGLVPEKQPRMYDDQESRKRIPPISQLYVSKISTLGSRS